MTTKPTARTPLDDSSGRARFGTEAQSGPEASPGGGLDRRRFLGLAAGAGLAGLAGCGAGSATPAAPSAPAGSAALPGAVRLAESTAMRAGAAGRRLVVVELSGGNDGLAMFQPTADTTAGAILRDLRSGLRSDDADLIAPVSGFGWHPRLAPLFEVAASVGVGVGAAVGVGTTEPGFSHFEMEQRWWQGDSAASSRQDTGFLGRICDELAGDAPVTGISFGGTLSPALMAANAVTVGLADAGSNWFLRENDAWLRSLRGSWAEMAAASTADSDPLAAARQGLGDATRFAAGVGQITGQSETDYPWTDLGRQLKLAAEAIVVDPRLRVLHVRHDGYDTHSGQDWHHGELMGELGDALAAFVGDLEARGFLGDTLIATTSEFGRRVEPNNGGTDHGGASTMLVCGPGVGSMAGQPPSLRSLDDANLVATARFEDYYASLTQDWLGLDPSLVLASGTPMTGLI